MGVILQGIVTKRIVAKHTPVEFVNFRGAGNPGPGATDIADATYAMLDPNPIAAQPGDLLIYIAVLNLQGITPGATNWTPPAGWTELIDQSFGTPTVSIGWRRLGTVAEEGQTAGSWYSSASGALILTTISYRNAAIDTVGTLGTQASGTATITIPGITTTAQNTLLQAIVVTTNATAWSGTSSPVLANTIWDSTSSFGQSPGTVVFGANQAQAGATGNVTTNFTTATGIHAGILISLKSL